MQIYGNLKMASEVTRGQRPVGVVQILTDKIAKKLPFHLNEFLDKKLTLGTVCNISYLGQTVWISKAGKKC